MARLKSSPSCETAVLVSAYLDGQLQRGELDIVVEHLAECQDCIAEFHEMKEIRAALRTLPALEIPERLLPDTHPGYIGWEQFEENQRTLRANAQAAGADLFLEKGALVEELLSGVLTAKMPRAQRERQGR